MDEDLDALSHAELLVAARRMRAATRVHREASGHDLCWHHPADAPRVVREHGEAPRP